MSPWQFKVFCRWCWLLCNLTVVKVLSSQCSWQTQPSSTYKIKRVGSLHYVQTEDYRWVKPIGLGLCDWSSSSLRAKVEFLTLLQRCSQHSLQLQLIGWRLICYLCNFALKFWIQRAVPEYFRGMRRVDHTWPHHHEKITF